MRLKLPPRKNPYVGQGTSFEILYGRNRFDLTNDGVKYLKKKLMSRQLERRAGLRRMFAARWLKPSSAADSDSRQMKLTMNARPGFRKSLIKTISTIIPITFLDRQGHHRTQVALFGGRYDMDLPQPPSADPPPMSSVANRPYVPEISRETIIDLVADMNRVGFGVLSGYLEPADLEDLRQFVQTAVAAAGGEYVVFTGEEPVAGPLLDTLSASPAFVNLVHQVYDQGCARPAPHHSLHHVLRRLQRQHALKPPLHSP